MNRFSRIELDSSPVNIIKAIMVFLIIVSSIMFCYGALASLKAEGERKREHEAEMLKEISREVAKSMEVNITNKRNGTEWTNSIEFAFDVEIKNNSDTNVNHIEGVLEIKDHNGKVLSSGTAEFGDAYAGKNCDFPANSTQKYILTWNAGRSDETIEIRDNEFSKLKFLFTITSIAIQDKKVVDLT